MPEPSIKDSLREAAEHFHSGRTLEADAVYRRILTQYPASRTPFLEGISCRIKRKTLAAITAFEKAIAAAPTHIEAILELAGVLDALGNFDQSMALQSRAIAFKPDSATARNKLGLALMNQGQLEKAAEEFQQAIKLNPTMPSFQGNLARLLGRQGDPQRADEIFHSAISCQPDCATAFYERGLLLLEIRAFDPAIADFENALRILNDDARPHIALMKSHRAKSNFGEAERVLQTAIALLPGSAELFEELGYLLQSLGRFEEAAASLTRSLDIHPGGPASLLLSRLSSSDDPSRQQRLTDLTTDQNRTPRDRAAAGFALGDFFDKTDKYDDAFDAYSKANALFKQFANSQGERFDPWLLEKHVSKTIETYSSEYFRTRAEFGQKSESPVFIVGMPRSGTSLVEQIVSSHSQAFGMGELPDIALIRARFAAANLNAADYPSQRHWHRHLAKLHLAKLEFAGARATRIIDKMPANVLHLGLIATMFPNARIILCHRNPIDTCLSCYFQLFENFNLMFSYSLSDCVTQHLQTNRLVAHWKQVLPLKMLEVYYEEMVGSIEVQSRKLIQFIDLDWEPACLNFHKTARPVLTRSAWQVRQQIYSSSVNRRINYQKHLGPLCTLTEQSAT